MKADVIHRTVLRITTWATWLTLVWRPFSRTTRVKSTPFRTLSPELKIMEMVVTTGAIIRAKLQPNHHHQQTNTQHFYRSDAIPVTQPTVSKHQRVTLVNETEGSTWATRLTFRMLLLDTIRIIYFLIRSVSQWHLIWFKPNGHNNSQLPVCK